MKPKVSVIIPTHNRRQLLIRLLDALQKQTLDCSEFEVLVVHNYSSDGTEEAIAQWQDSNCRLALRYFIKHYRGPAASRQFGADNAAAPILAFIDDDCIPQEDWLERGIEKFHAADHADSRPGLVQGRTLPNPDQPRRYLEKTVTINQASIYYETCNIFYWKAAFRAVAGFSPDFLDKFYGEDTDLGWKVRLAGYPTLFCEEALVYHEVFHVSFWQWLKEPLFFKNLPYLVRKYPALREHMVAGYFLSLETALFNLLVVSLLLTLTISPYSLLLSLPYLVQRYRSGSRIANLPFRLLRIVAGLPRGCMMFFALARGTLTYRSILL